MLCAVGLVVVAGLRLMNWEYCARAEMAGEESDEDKPMREARLMRCL